MLWEIDFLLMREDDTVCAFLERILELDRTSARSKDDWEKEAKYSPRG